MIREQRCQTVMEVFSRYKDLELKDKRKGSSLSRENPGHIMFLLYLWQQNWILRRLRTVFIHETAIGYDKVFVSAGRVGFQIELAPEDLIGIAGCTVADIV